MCWGSAETPLTFAVTPKQKNRPVSGAVLLGFGED
jgi:hypothetical protein